MRNCTIFTLPQTYLGQVGQGATLSLMWQTMANHGKARPVECNKPSPKTYEIHGIGTSVEGPAKSPVDRSDRWSIHLFIPLFLGFQTSSYSKKTFYVEIFDETTTRYLIDKTFGPIIDDN